MKKSREQIKTECMEEAEKLFDELMSWDEENEAPNMTQHELSRNAHGRIPCR